MPYPKFEIEDLGVVEVGEIPTTEVDHSAFEIPPEYFKACHNRHVDVGKVSYSVLIFPKSLHFSHYIVSATLRTMHDVNTPCERPGMIVDDEDYYQIEARFNRLYQEDPFAELDDFIAELERQNGIPASGGDPTAPTPMPQPADPNPHPAAGGNQPVTPSAPTAPEETEETEAQRRAREELERARERARELESGDEQVFIDPDNDWMGGLVACHHKNTYRGIQVYVDDFTWYERPGRIIPYPSKDYFVVMKAPSQYYALRYTYSFSKHKADINNNEKDMVSFRVSAMPVAIDDGAQFMVNQDQTVNKKVWTLAMIAQLSQLPSQALIRLEKLNQAQKDQLLTNPGSASNLTPEYQRVMAKAKTIAGQLMASGVEENTAHHVALDIAVTMNNHAMAKTRDRVNNCKC